MPRSAPLTRPFATHRIRTSLTLLVAVVAVLASAYHFARPTIATAVPALSVSTSVSRPLVGGIARVTVTITNTGADKGYNLSIDTTTSSSIGALGKFTIVNPTVPATALGSTGTTTSASYVDLVDLAPTESYSLSYDVQLDPTIPGWEVGDLVRAAVSARVNTVPDNSGSWIAGAANAQADVIPIDLVTKTANQTTGIHQATGTGPRAYTYSIVVQNNYVNQSSSVVVTDTLPDGLEYLGVVSGPALTSGGTHVATSGVTPLRWDLGTMAAGQRITITYQAGVRYDYYGTANGGNNRVHSDFLSGKHTTSTPIAHKTDFSNTARLASLYKGALPATITPTDQDSENVTGAYITVNKSGSPTVGGHGTIVDYTVTYATSEYYTADSVTMTDTLGDGLSYVPGSSHFNGVPLEPATVTHNADGTTLLVWTPAQLGAIGTTSLNTIAFQGVVDTTWEAAPDTGDPIRAGDSVANGAILGATWHDQANVRTGSDTLVAQVAAGLATRLPGITKEVWDPIASAWSTASINAQVGDRVQYRVRFNTVDGATPERSDISLGYIALTDWLPPGTAYDGNAAPSYVATFSVPGTGSPPSINPTLPVPVTLGGLSGIQWFLGDVSADGWWETTFTVTVQNAPAVTPGLKTGNHWKLTGMNTDGQEYSDRAISPMTYVAPALTISKATTSLPAPIVASSVITYAVNVTNTGLGTARSLLVTDTIPAGMRTATPTVVSATIGTDTVPAPSITTTYTRTTGVFAVRVEQSLQPSQTLNLLIRSTINSTTTPGPALTNTVQASCTDQDNRVGRAYTSNSANATVNLAQPTVVKGGPTSLRTIGETMTYDATITVPAGAVMYWPRIVDRFTNDGIFPVAGTSSLTDVTGTPVAPATFGTAGPDPVRLTGPANQTEFVWDLANPIDNRGQSAPYSFRLTFTAMYTGVVDAGPAIELFPPTGAQTITNNRARIEWNTTDTATRPAAPGQGVNSGSIVTPMRQPLIRTAKSLAGGSGPYAGGSPLTYRVTLTNPGFSRAYDLNMRDVLPAYVGSPAFVSASHTRFGDISGSVTPDFSAPPTLTVDFGALSLGTTESITVTFTAAVDPNVPSGAIMTNTVDANWSSLAGTPAGSRRYADASWETATWTQDTTTAVALAALPTIDKTVSYAAGSSFGSEYTYSLLVTVPTETVLPNSFLSDLVARDGVTLTGASIVPVSGNPQTAAALAGTLSDITPNPGTRLTFLLAAPIDNADAAAGIGDTPYVFRLVYTLGVNGISDLGTWEIAPPAASGSLNDTGTLTWNSGAATATVVDPAVATVAQPLLRQIKSVVSPGPFSGADTVRYSASITNTSSAVAHDLTWRDDYASYMSAGSFVSATHSAAGSLAASLTADFTNGNAATIDFDDTVTLAPGESIAVVWDVVIDPGVGVGMLLTDTADVDWASAAVGTTGRRVYDDGPLEAAWTADTSTASVTVMTSEVSKDVVGGDTTPTIGEEFEYDVIWSVPASTTAYAMVLNDLMPDGLTLVSTSGVPAIGTITVSPEVAGRTPVLWTVGNISNPPDSTLRLRLRARVDETYFGGAPVTRGQSIANSATLTWFDDPGLTSPHASSASTTITVIEPSLSLDKTVSTSSLEPGDVATYTVTMVNTGTSPAYDLRFADRVPDPLFASGTSPQLASVRLDGAPLASPADYTADFSSSPTVTVDLVAPVPADSTLEIVYAATLAPGTAPGQTLPNLARATYTSLPGPSAHERTYGPLTDIVPITTRGPGLAATKSVSDAHAQRGDEVTYTVTITNVGDAPAYAVNASDTLPAGFAYVAGTAAAVWPTGSSTAGPVVSGGGLNLDFDFGGAATLAPSETLDLTFRALVRNIAASGTATNVVTGTGLDGGGGPVPRANATATLEVTRPRVNVNKVRSSADARVQVGQTVTFDIGVTNTGDSEIATLPLVDTFEAAYLDPLGASPMFDTGGAGHVDWNDITGAGTLPVGATTTVTVTFDVIGHPPLSSTRDTATVSAGIDVFGDPVPTDTDNALLRITAPSVALTKVLAAGQAATVSAGATVTFDIGVTNTGDTTIGVLPLSDTYDPARLDFVSATPTRSTAPAGSITWNNLTNAWGDLAPGRTETVTVTFRALSESLPTTNGAAIAGGAATDVYGDPLPGAASTAPVGIVEPDLALSKTVSTTNVGPGDPATYTVTVANNGTGPAHEIALRDRIPVELFASGVSPQLAAVTIDGSPLSAPADYVYDFVSSRNITLDMVTPLPAGSTLQVVYSVRLDGGTASGLTLTNNARVASYTSLPGADPNDVVYGPLTDSVPLTTRAPALATTKAVSDAHAQRGDEVTYTVTITNTGDAPAYAVEATDTLPPDVDYVPGTAAAVWPTGSSGADPAIGGGGARLTFDFGGAATLAPSETLTLTFRAIVRNAAASGTATNTVTGRATDGGGGTVPRSSADATLDVTRPSVNVNKVRSSADARVQVGQTVSFDIGVTNTGDTEIATVQVVDTFEAAYLSPAGATPAYDASGAGFVVWNDITGAGTLPVGSTTTVTVTFDVIGRPATASTRDTATVPAAIDVWGDPTPSDRDGAIIRITAPSVGLTKVLSAGQAATVSVGATVAFDIGVTNTGDTTIGLLPLIDTFDSAALGFLSASPVQSGAAPGTITWNDLTTAWGDVAPGRTDTVTVTFRALDEALPTLNSSTITSGTARDIYGDWLPGAAASAPVAIVEPDLAMSKAVSTTTVAAGEVATYTVTITNTGTGAAHEIALRDRVPDELFAAGTSPLLATVTLDGAPLTSPTDYVADFSSSATITLDMVAPLPAGSTLEVVYAVTLTGGTPGGLTLWNDAQVTSYTSLPGTDPNDVMYGPLTDTVPLITRAPALAAAKSVSDAHVQRGQEVTYTVTITNTGDAPAYAVNASDTLPAGFSYVAGTAAAAWPAGSSAADPAVAGDTLTFDFGGAATLAPSDTLTLAFRALVGASAASGTSTNTVTGMASDGGGGPVPLATADAPVDVTRPEVSVVKIRSSADAHVQVGQTVSFDIGVTNTGDVAIETLPLTDDFDAAYLDPLGASPMYDTGGAGHVDWNDITGAGTLAPGATTTVTVTFDVIGHPSTSSSTDTATVTGATDIWSDPVPDDTSNAPIGITAPSVTVRKMISAGYQRTMPLGSQVAFDLVVTNSGDTTIVDLPLADEYDHTRLGYISALPVPSSVTSGSLIWNDLTASTGDIAPGAQTTVTVLFSAVGAGASVPNSATATPAGTDVHGDPLPISGETTHVDIFDPGDVSLLKSADPTAGTIVLPGDTITYYLAVHNGSGVTLPAVSVSDEITGSITYVASSMRTIIGSVSTSVTDAADSDGGTFDAADGPFGTVLGQLGDLAPSETATLAFSVTVRDAEFSRRGVLNSFSAQIPGFPLGDSNTVDHGVDPFDLVKTGRDVNGGRLESGDTIEWTIVLTNTGFVPTTNTRVTDRVPSQTTYVAGSITGPGRDDSGAPDLVWAVGTVPPGDTVTMTFRSKVKSGLPAGTVIRNQAVATADQSPTKVSDSPSTPAEGDPTLLRTGGDDWVWFAAAALAVLLGCGVLAYVWRTRRRDGEPAAAGR